MVVVLNSSAGTAAASTNDVRTEITSRFAAHNLHPKIVDPAEADEAIAHDDLIVAAGGDGTISTVAAKLTDTGKTMGVLPLGTLNHFAKDLRIPLELDDAIATIADAHTVDVDVAQVNDRVFINNSSLGIYPHIVARREAQQVHLKRSKWTAFASAF